MEIICIEKGAFEMMMGRFNEFVTRLDALLDQYGPELLGELYDNQDVCLRLRICPRTLQTIRDKRIIPFTRIERRIYYRPEDIEALARNYPEMLAKAEAEAAARAAASNTPADESD